MSSILLIGMGYVGSTLAGWLGGLGHTVLGVEQDERRLEALKKGEPPVYEPGLSARMELMWREKRLFVVSSCSQALPAPDVAIIAVNTPTAQDGSAALQQLEKAIDDLLELPGDFPIVIRSTVPPGTAQMLFDRYPGLVRRYHYIPDFFRQGHALEDLKSPQRVVIGADDADGAHAAALKIFAVPERPLVTCSVVSAELIKYCSNAYLAMKISYSNEVAEFARVLDAKLDDVLEGMGLDVRIGRTFLQAGLGFGDSCLPKDTRGYQACGDRLGVSTDLIDATLRINYRQRSLIPRMLATAGLAGEHWTRVAVLGVRYLTSSDDMREAPSAWVIPQVRALSDSVVIWDEAADRLSLSDLFPACDIASNVEEALDGAEMCIILGRWPSLRSFNWSGASKSMLPPALVIDPTNFLDAQTLRRNGLDYLGYGKR